MFTPTNNMEAFLCKHLKVFKSHVHIFCCLVQIKHLDKDVKIGILNQTVFNKPFFTAEN